MTVAVKKLYHVSAFSWYVYVVRSLAAKDGEELPPGIFVYGGPWKYLTFLNLMFFFGVAALNDLHPGKTPRAFLGRFKDFLFSVFVFPVGSFVVLLFWAIFSYDRELVYPATIDAFFPPWMNHAMHTFVLPIILGEILLQPHVYPTTKLALTVLTVVGVAYLSWIIWVYVSVGIWVYPLLGRFSSAGLVFFFFFNMTVVLLLFKLGSKLNASVWRRSGSD